MLMSLLVMSCKLEEIALAISALAWVLSSSSEKSLPESSASLPIMTVVLCDRLPTMKSSCDASSAELIPAGGWCSAINHLIGEPRFPSQFQPEIVEPFVSLVRLVLAQRTRPILTGSHLPLCALRAGGAAVRYTVDCFV